MIDLNDIISIDFMSEYWLHPCECYKNRSSSSP